MAQLDYVSLYGAASRARPSKYADQAQAPVHLSNRGDVCTQSVHGAKMFTAAMEGSYFVATNPTVATGIAGIAAADGYNAAETLFLLYNTSTQAEGIQICLDFLELQCTVVDTAGTDIRFDHHIDNTDRYTSGGTLITPVSPNMDSSASAKGRLRFGAVVSAAASSSVRYLGGRQLSSTDLVANDLMLFTYGGSNSFSSQGSNLTEEATLARLWQVACPAVVLGPGCSYLFTINCASQSGAATWTFNCGWTER
jgi:hypothetical protein